MKPSPLTLTIDIGTSSSRALLWTIEGKEAAHVKAQVHYHMRTTPDGGVEMDAEDLLQHVGTCLDEALQQAGESAKRIQAVGISTYWHSLLGIDKYGKPLTPIYNWADTRAGEAARRLRTDLNEKEIHARTGCMIHPSYYPAKLAWLRETKNETFRRTSRWVSPSEYLFQRLFTAKESSVSVSMASGTGLFNQEKCAWDKATLDAIGISEDRLAPIVDLKHCSVGLANEFASRWPALKDVPFFPAIGDGACGNVGSGCVTQDRMAINLGTSGAIRVLWQEKHQTGKSTIKYTAPPLGLWRYRADSLRPLIGAAFSDGGDVFEWMCRTLNLPPVEELEKELAKHEPCAHGLSFLPFLAGERSLGWNPDSRASLTGLNLNTSPLDILRASMEAVALRFALAANLLSTLFPKAKEIIASGGALGNSPAWTQIFADALGQPVTLAVESEASSRGAALLAMEAAGILANVEDAEARMGRTFDPRSHYNIRYKEKLEEQQLLYGKLIDQSDAR